MAEWEAEIRIRRNGRCVKIEKAPGDTPASALYNVHNDVELWAQAHPESGEYFEDRYGPALAPGGEER